MVQAAKLSRNLVSELKQTTIFSGFGSLNENMNRRIAEFNRLEEKHKFPPHVEDDLAAVNPTRPKLDNVSFYSEAK
ncbi:hypothetical protein OPV22_022355 [Ensete ventricosum]|uniref:Uncharacterized protein n=1 Tax=Ensete ventricosum TaxID=4639 RepID=A0AAV8QPQ5_ENSVE|nr:hypothetical protein OPV22_022355 [Ensete ventricosum]